jgi:hypothetical protein
MKRANSHYRAHPKPYVTRAQMRMSTALIRLNTSSIRNKALKDYQKAERELERHKNLLKRYHEEDIPGFRSWIHKNFGHLLTRQRELAQALDENRNTVFEIQALASRYHLPEAAAYKKLLWRRAHPAEAEEEDRQWEEAMERKRKKSNHPSLDDIFGDEDDDGFTDFESELADMPDDAKAGFTDFFEEMTGIRLPHRSSETSNAEGKTAKELYRTIVRRLHPDHHGQMSEARKVLWHEAQAAYRQKDTNALYNILARCDGGESGLGAQSAVSLIQNLTRQLKQSLRTTKQEIKQVKRDPAWDFHTRTQDPKFGQKIRRELEDEITNGEWNLKSVENLLKQLEREANRPPPRHGRPRRYERDPFDIF